MAGLSTHLRQKELSNTTIDFHVPNLDFYRFHRGREAVLHQGWRRTRIVCYKKSARRMALKPINPADPIFCVVDKPLRVGLFRKQYGSQTSLAGIAVSWRTGAFPLLTIVNWMMHSRLGEVVGANVQMFDFFLKSIHGSNFPCLETRSMSLQYLSIEIGGGGGHMGQCRFGADEV